MPFLSLGLSPALAAAAAAQGFATPTPVQAAAIPAVLRGADVLASARTGSGKTAAFALPMLQRVAPHTDGKKRSVQALVLLPTRELAVQVGEVLRLLAQAVPQAPRVSVVFGGVSVNPQMMGLRGGTDVLVATPGRLLDLVTQNAVALETVRMLVLDEADRLLDMGFAEELQAVLALLPAERQTLLFSATFPDAVLTLADSLLQQPERIAMPTAPGDGSAERPTIVQRAIRVDAARRTALLRHLFKAGDWERALVFVATQHAAERVADKLYQSGIFATPFHGALSQGARQRALDDFKAGRWDMLVTTDLASRGIDIAQLPVVVNYDLPRSAVDYVHRIGRTGRAGEPGIAVTFVDAASEAHWHLIDKRQGLALASEVVEGFEPLEVAAPTPTVPDAAGTGGVKGRRPSKKDKLRAAAAAVSAAPGATAQPCAASPRDVPAAEHPPIPDRPC